MLHYTQHGLFNCFLDYKQLNNKFNNLKNYSSGIYFPVNKVDGFIENIFWETAMDIKTFTFAVSTKGNTDILDITDKVREIVRDSDFQEGNALIFAPGSTAGITTIEYEPGLILDYPAFMERIIPSNINYQHDNTWHDGNGHSHVRASLQGASFMVPFMDKDLLLGTWQQIILIDFDNRSRNRKVIVQLTGK